MRIRFLFPVSFLILPTLLFSVVTLAFGTAAPASGQTAGEESEYGVLVDKPGVDLTHAYCAACHSERIVAQQGMTRKNWDKLFEWMVEEQGMSEIEEPDRTVILDYLAEHYNIDRPNFPY